ncbi:hypothetical protein [Chroococcidiopsis cubana]|nr:hypothetical protein [Chroococcidiopsis cubana]
MTSTQEANLRANLRLAIAFLLCGNISSSLIQSFTVWQLELMYKSCHRS